MAENTTIEWATHTFNPWIGCTKVGPGCENCYAETLAKSRLGVPWGPGAERRRTMPANWRKPVQWNRLAGVKGIRPRVFCASLADVFDNEIDPQWRADLFELIRATPNLDWLLLTKRIGNVAKMAAAAGGLPDNVWLGATIVNQEEADRDIPKLLATPARVRFLSMEPLLSGVDIRWALDHAFDIAAGFLKRGFFSPGLETLRRIDLIIVGGESGPGARPMHPAWARSLRDQCAAAGVPFLFKQWGEWVPRPSSEMTIEQAMARSFPRHAKFPDGVQMIRSGKKAAGRLLDGVQHDGVSA